MVDPVQSQATIGARLDKHDPFNAARPDQTASLDREASRAIVFTFNLANSSLKFTPLVVLSWAFALAASGRNVEPSSPEVTRTPLPSRPNIVFILTDDQRWDEIDHMPNVRASLQLRGITFTNGFVSNPLCTPSRATILTGRHSRNHGVWSNQAADSGGWETFRDNGAESHTIATVLKDAGYYTGLIGKYMGGYRRENADWVPPGWDTWNAFTLNRYYGPNLSIQGTNIAFSVDEYSTDIIGQLAIDFIQGAPAGQPLFLYWAPKTPHRPYIPLESDRGSLAHSLLPLRPASYNEPDVSDKPWYVQRTTQWDQARQATWDQVRQHRYESLISVDRWVGRIIDALEAESRLWNTLIVFTSDNGFLLGEHRTTGKVVPYEESIRVPWIVRWDAANFPERGRTNGSLMLNTDFAPTFARVAGTSMRISDGLDFTALAVNQSRFWRRTIPLERGGTISDTFAGLTYCGVRSRTHTYVKYWNGFEELYDLSVDPDQLTNILASGSELSDSQSAVLGAHRSSTRHLCDPVPPGFTWTH
jgi:arylsulfatase A-like enzyme